MATQTQVTVKSNVNEAAYAAAGKWTVSKWFVETDDRKEGFRTKGERAAVRQRGLPGAREVLRVQGREQARDLQAR